VGLLISDIFRRSIIFNASRGVPWWLKIVPAASWRGGRRGRAAFCEASRQPGATPAGSLGAAFLSLCSANERDFLAALGATRSGLGALLTAHTASGGGGGGGLRHAPPIVQAAVVTLLSLAFSKRSRASRLLKAFQDDAGSTAFDRVGRAILVVISAIVPDGAALIALLSALVGVGGVGGGVAGAHVRRGGGGAKIVY
jgi:hypothetical protein